MSQQPYEPLSKSLVSYVRQSTIDALLSYCERFQRSRDTVVDTALDFYLNGQANGEVEHLQRVVEMQQSQITELLGTHDQP
jgi:hypothetical protein